MSRFIIISIFCLQVSVATAQNFSYLSEYISESSLVVEAAIVGERSFWDKDQRNIYTSFELKVNTFFKGNSSVNPEIIIMGGKINDLMQIVSTSPSLNVGDYGIFILFKLPMENKICADTDNKYLLTKGKNCYVLIEKDSCKIETLEGSLVNDEKINCIEEITGKTIKYNKQEIMLKSTAANHSISGFSPKEITAGTGEVLRIFGSGFGNTQGTSTVWFRYADNPNQIFTSSNGFKVSLWSDEEIQIVVPSKAATGNIFVNINDVKAESTEELKVKFNVQQEYYKPQYLINTNEKGGYTFHFHSNINKFVGAKEQIEKSINEWICSTSVPWEIGNSQSVEPGMDGICSVQFGDLSDGGGETLGRASIILQETSFLNSNDYVLKEVDVIFSQKENWCFNNSKITDQQIDFLSVALHEFGHAHLLGHVNDVDDLMHYAITSGEIRDIGNNNVLCGKYILNQSILFKNEKFKTIQIRNTPTPAFSVKGDTLYSTNEFITYQWFLNGEKIANSTNRRFVITQSGSYSLQITDNNNCVKLSDSKYVAKSGSSLISFLCPPDISIDTILNSNQSVYIKVPKPEVQNPGNETYSLTNNFNKSNDASGLYPMGKTIVTWKLTDKNGKESTCSHNITIIKKQESVLTMICPPNIELNCLDSFPEKYSTLYDFEKAGGIAFSSSTYVIDTLFKMESEVQDSNHCQIKLLRTYSIPDYDLNFATCSHEITVFDSEPPILNCPSDLNIKNEIDLPETLKNIVDFFKAGGYVYDFCAPSYLLQFEYQIDTSNNYLSKRFYSFIDICGNLSTCIQNIAIEYPTFSESHSDKQKLNIKTYPNPTHDDVTFNINGITNSKVLLEIYSNNGVKVFTQEFYPDGYNLSEKINLSDQPRGNYQVKVIDGEYIQTSSLIIQ